MIERVDIACAKQRMDAFARKLGVEPRCLPTCGEPWHEGRPHIEVDGEYHLVTYENGIGCERRSTEDLETLLYWIFEEVTFAMAAEYELQHRRLAEDSRRQIFSKHIELLGRLLPRWTLRKAAEQGDILKRYPYSDAVDIACH